MLTNEAQLNVAVLTYAAECLAEGKIDALLQLGFNRADLEVLQDLSLADMPRLGSLGAHFLRVRIDRDRLQRAATHIRREREQQRCRDRLIAHDAPLALVHAISGMSSSEYRGMRKLYDLNSVGRPPEPTEAQEQAVWRELRSLGKSIDMMDFEDWLAIEERTETPLRVIWGLAQRWGEEQAGEQDEEYPARAG